MIKKKVKNEYIYIMSFYLYLTEISTKKLYRTEYYNILLINSCKGYKKIYFYKKKNYRYSSKNNNSSAKIGAPPDHYNIYVCIGRFIKNTRSKLVITLSQKIVFNTKVL